MVFKVHVVRLSPCIFCCHSLLLFHISCWSHWCLLLFTNQDFKEKNLDLMRPDVVMVLKSSSVALVRELVGADPVALFRWAILRAFFRSYHALRRTTSHSQGLCLLCALIKLTASQFGLQFNSMAPRALCCNFSAPYLWALMCDRAYEEHLYDSINVTAFGNMWPQELHYQGRLLNIQKTSMKD